MDALSPLDDRRRKMQIAVMAGIFNYNGNIVIIGIFNGDYNGNAGCNRDVLR